MLSFLKKLFRPEKRPYCAAVVAAAGLSRRMEGQDKLFLSLRGMPVLAHSLLALQASPQIDEIVVVTREDLILATADLCRRYEIGKATKIIKGGDTRLRSVLFGTAEVSPRAALIAVHDGARPLVSAELISAVVHSAAERGAAAPAIPVTDTIKIAEDGVIRHTPERNKLYAMQTPQVFDAQMLCGALQQAELHAPELTDDCAALERIGMPVWLVPGERCNIKITMAEDLAVAEALLAWREGEA